MNEAAQPHCRIPPVSRRLRGRVSWLLMDGRHALRAVPLRFSSQLSAILKRRAALVSAAYPVYCLLPPLTATHLRGIIAAIMRGKP